MVLKTAALVFLGGGLGASSRYGLNLAVTTLTRGTIIAKFPLGILLCNLLGCFLIGCAFGAFSHKQDTHIFPFLVTGFLGGFTTFSTFGKDTHGLLISDMHGHAFLNIAASILLGLLAVYGGYRITSS